MINVFLGVSVFTVLSAFLAYNNQRLEAEVETIEP